MQTVKTQIHSFKYFAKQIKAFVRIDVAIKMNKKKKKKKKKKAKFNGIVFKILGYLPE